MALQRQQSADEKKAIQDRAQTPHPMTPRTLSFTPQLPTQSPSNRQFTTTKNKFPRLSEEAKVLGQQRHRQLALDHNDDRLIYASLNDWVSTKLKSPCGAPLGRTPGAARCRGKQRLIQEPCFEGHQVTFKTQCEDHIQHINTISNYKEERILQKITASGGKKANSGILHINMRSVLAHTFAGHDFESVRMFETIMMGRHMYNSQWTRLQPRIWEAVALEFGKSSEVVEEMIRKSGDWTMVADAGWSNRGWTAYHCSLPIIWFEKKLVILHVNLSKDIKRHGKVIIKGNYQGGSKGMEGAALRQSLTELHNKGILPMCKNIVIDKDSSSTKTMKSLAICQHITVRYDPGHAKKSFVNQLLKV